MADILLVFYKNRQKHVGRISEDIYYSELFSIFRDHLIPLSTYEYKQLKDDEKKFIEDFKNAQT